MYSSELEYGMESLMIKVIYDIKNNQTVETQEEFLPSMLRVCELLRRLKSVSNLCGKPTIEDI